MVDVTLSHVRESLEALDYPVSKATAIDELGDVQVEYADGEEPLVAVLSRSNDDEFESTDDLETEIFSNVSIGAVGEPGQSEGEG